MPIISPKSPANLARFQTLQDVQALKPEWLRIPAAMRVSGFSRNQIFEGVVTGKIRSKHLKSPGAKKGIRLINYDSLMAFIESLEE
jgi:hypothetical protein